MSVAPFEQHQSVFVEIRRARQVTVGAVSVGSVGVAVVLVTGRGAFILVRAALDVAAVVFRHLQEQKGLLESSFVLMNFFLQMQFATLKPDVFLSVNTKSSKTNSACYHVFIINYIY